MVVGQISDKNNTLIDPQLLFNIGPQLSDGKDDKKTKKTDAVGNDPLKTQSNLLIAVWWILASSVQISTESTAVHAKAVNQEAGAEQKLNIKLQDKNLVTVPKRILKETVEKITNPDDPLIHHGKRVSGEYYEVTVVKNQKEVTNAETKNQEIIAERQGLQDQFSKLQMQTSIEAAKISSLGNGTVSDMQEASGFLDAIKQMTFDANLTKPPQGA